MGRSNVVTTVLVAVAITLVSIFLLMKRNRSQIEYLKWTFDYGYQGKAKAYDRDFMIDMLKSQPDVEFEELKERFSKEYATDRKGMYFFYDRNFTPDSTESAALVDYVSKGNSAVIIAQSFGGNIFKYIRGVRQLQSENYKRGSHDSARYAHERVWVKSISRNTKLEVVYYGYFNQFRTSFEVDVPESDDEYSLYEGDWETDEYLEQETEEEYDVEYQVYGSTKDHGDNVLKVTIGKGELYLHCTPVMFTNIQLAKPDIFNYANTLFGSVEYEKIYWDQLRYQFLNDSRDNFGLRDRSYFQYIFENKPLRTAFMFLLSGVLVFVVLGVKRKYSPIEIKEPLTNSSIDFSKTIARLYWLNPDHKKIAEKKVEMFLAEVRNRYGITTYKLDDEFRQVFIAKSGVNERHINRLFDAYGTVKRLPTTHEDVLIRISESIAYIRQNWK